MSTGWIKWGYQSPTSSRTNFEMEALGANGVELCSGDSHIAQKNWKIGNFRVVNQSTEP